MKLVQDQKNDAFFIEKNKGRSLWTVYLTDSTCKSGEYADEFDVWANTIEQAKDLAQIVKDAIYDYDCKVSRVKLLF